MEKLKNEELGRKSVEEFKSAKKLPVSILLDDVRSALNVGSVFRSSDAFLIEKIFLCGITATPPNRDVLKTALGATDTVEWEYAENAVDKVNELKESSHLIFPVEQVKESVALHKFTWQKERKIVLVFGHEVNGVSQEIIDLADACIEIPQFGSKHSLNISVAVGVTLWEVIRKLDYFNR